MCRIWSLSSYLESVDSGQTSDSSLSSQAVGSPEACSLNNSPGDRDDNIVVACDHNVTPKHHEESSQVSRERVEDTEMPLPNLTNEPSKAQSETSQVFQEAPPSNAILPMEGGVHVSYWSRAARKRKLLLRVGNDSNQTLITH